MTINTEIKGDPASVRALGKWFETSIAKGMQTAITSAYKARTDTEADWGGTSGPAFRQRMTTGTRKAAIAVSAAKRAAEACEDWAEKTEKMKKDMEKVRKEAQSAGLTVTATTISPPGKAPQAPPAGTTGTQMTTYNQHAAAYKKAVEAYKKAGDDVKEIRADQSFLAKTMRNVQNDITGKPPFLVATSFANDGYVGPASKWYATRGPEKAAAIRAAIQEKARGFHQAGQMTRVRQIALREEARNARGWEKFGKWSAKWGKFTGPGSWILGAAGTAYDIKYNDKSPSNAIASYFGGNLIGMAAGPAVGAGLGALGANPVTIAVGGAAGSLAGSAIGSAIIDTAWDKTLKDSGAEKWMDKKLEQGWDGATKYVWEKPKEKFTNGLKSLAHPRF